MKRRAKLLAFILALMFVFAAPTAAQASTTTSTIFLNTKYVHQTKYDGYDISEGIDVSYHNSKIDFEKVKAAGVKFVIIRAGCRGYAAAGTIINDYNFETYIKDAHEAGLDIGVYFYSQALNESEARAEAEFTIKKMAPYKDYITLPVAYDYEFADVSSGRLDSAWRNGTINKASMTRNAIAFCTAVENAGYDAMIYASKYFLLDNLDYATLEKKYDIWLAHYIKNTNYVGEYRIWQFSDKGTVGGISGYVDSNFMYTAGFEVNDVANCVYSGKAQKPAVTVSKDGKKLTLNTDYTLSYKNNTAAGEASVTVTGKGDYAKYPKVTKYFDIIPNVVTGLKATSIKAETLSVSWSKYSGAAGYEVWIKLPSGWKNLGNTADNSYTFEKLTATTDYEISVRAYVKAGEREIYGKYGEYLKVKTADLLPSPPANSTKTGWVKFNDEWYYFLSGTAAKSRWVKVNGEWYYFDEKCAMQTGWLKLDGKTYYLSDSGAMAKYFNKIDGDWYYFTGNGDMRTGWLPSGDKRYYLGEDGKMAVGFTDIGANRYYFNEKGIMLTGWFDADKKRYYAASSGELVRYRQMIAGEHYYFTGSYYMKTGWLKIGSAWYYYAEDGKRASGWIDVGSARYYLDENGVMQTGWREEDGKKYYLRDSGAMAKYFTDIDGKRYYFNAKGVLQTGWLYSSKQWYYLDADGVMLKYRQTIDSKKYYFNGQGVMYKGWLQISGSWYYYGSDGAMVTGKKTINGKLYTFNENGVMQ